MFKKKVKVIIRRGKAGKYYFSIPEAKIVSAVPGFSRKDELMEKVEKYFRPIYDDQTFSF